MTPRCWVFFAQQAKPTSLRKAIATRLGESEPVLIVELPVSGIRQPARWPLRRRVAGIVYRPFHLPERMPVWGDVLRRSNTTRLIDEMNRLCPPDKRIVCYDSPTQYDLVGRLSESLSVYLAIDDLTVTLTGEPISGESEKEKELLAKVDSVMCVSQTLARALRDRMPPQSDTPIEVLQNCFNERLFDPDIVRPEPSALRCVPRPRGLVVGHISERIDWDGIASCRRTLRSVQWVFVGPAERGMQERIESIGGHCFDTIPISDVPAWIDHCDFCAVPYRLNRFTQASSPIKAFEYLAMGAPTLATRVTGLQALGDSLAWVDDGGGSSYAAAVERLHSEGRACKFVLNRRAAVANSSLAARVAQFVEHIGNMTIRGRRRVQRSAGMETGDAPAANLTRHSHTRKAVA